MTPNVPLGGTAARGAEASAAIAAYASPGLERKAFRMSDGLQTQIHVKVRPVKVAGRRLLNVDDLAYRRLSKPGKLFERQEQFFVPRQQPEAMARYVRYFNRRSGRSKRS